MFRSSLIAAGAALLCTAASAQHQQPTSRMFPITSPVKNAGTVDVTTGKWTKPGQSTKAGSQLIYNNTCTWQTSGFYAGFDWCEDNYDVGRIPGTSAGSNTLGQSGVQDVNTILSIQVSYCTFIGPILPGPGYDMDLAFYDKLGGACVGGISPTPPPISSAANSYIPLAGLSLPGSTTINFQACWLVTLDMSNTGMVIGSDGGDGIFDGTDVDDNFAWMQRQNMTVGALNGLSAGPDGFFITGEPLSGGFGACSYNIACGNDILFGNTCGTGLDDFDNHWINVDGIASGSSGQPAGCVNTVAQYGYGSNCYFFGGYPTGSWAGFYLVLESDGRATGAEQFCTQNSATNQPSVAGCYATLSATDLTMSGSWSVTNIPRSGTLASAGSTFGIWIYNNTLGMKSTSLNDMVFGNLCLPTFKRSFPACAPATISHPTWAPVTGACTSSVTSLAVNCSATLGLAAGQHVNAQFWFRDPTNVSGGAARLSNAIYYQIQ